jgi:hypothetical protein
MRYRTVADIKNARSGAAVLTTVTAGTVCVSRTVDGWYQLRRSGCTGAQVFATLAAAMAAAYGSTG